VGDTATTITIFYAVVVVIGVLVALAIAWSTLVRPRARTDTTKLAHREQYWLVGVMGVLAILLFSTIFLAPYGESAGPGGQVVRVGAFQFGWKIAPSQVRVGRPVEFRLEAADVNHGFGLYDENDVLLKQVQVMPDRQQRLVYTFDQPGVYRILCMEYCGVGHHLMESTIRVVE